MYSFQFDSFRIIKFHKYNLPWLNKEYNSSFIVDQIKYQVVTNIDYIPKIIIVNI